MSKGEIIITGGSGYIGSHTVLELIRNKELEVISIDSGVNSFENTYDRIRDITGVKVTHHKADLRDPQALEKIFSLYKNIKGVIHFAALKSVPESVANPLYYYDNNINGLINILGACKKFGVENFIFSSSCSVYGNVKTLPVNEDTALESTESPYAHTKIVGEQLIKNFVATCNVKAIALRYFNPVGADISGKLGENPVSDAVNNLVPVITRTAAGIIPFMKVYGKDYNTRDGSCIRDYIHVTDIADAHIKAMTYLIEGKNKHNFEVFNLGSGNGVTVVEAIKAFEAVSGIKLKYEMTDRRQGDVESIYSDSSKAEKILGWKPKFGIKEMMDSAWKWQLHITPSVKA